MMSITIKANSLFPRVNFTTETWRKPDLSTTSYEKDLKVFFDRRLITNQSCGSNDSEVSLSNTQTHTHTHTHTHTRARAHTHKQQARGTAWPLNWVTEIDGKRSLWSYQVSGYHQTTTSEPAGTVWLGRECWYAPKHNYLGSRSLNRGTQTHLDF
jgi:hypothetical protein